jgi:endonuclease III
VAKALKPIKKIAKPPKSAAETRAIMTKLERQHPNADTELHYSNAYQLLVATILSAQCTDERVNQVTPALFTRYPDASALAAATTGELEPQIQSTGFFRAKSKSLSGMAHAVVERHRGEIPADMDALIRLPGVGRKTANVVLGHALGVPGLPVDRHVLRVSNRIGIAKGDDPEVVEQQLCDAMPKEKWTLTSDTLILHGRRVCKPKPLCDSCAVRDNCLYYRSLIARPPRGNAATTSRPTKGSRRTPQGAGNTPATSHPARARVGSPQGASNPPATNRPARARVRSPQGTGNTPATSHPAKARVGSPQGTGNTPATSRPARAPLRSPQGTGNTPATSRPARAKK